METENENGESSEDREELPEVSPEENGVGGTGESKGGGVRWLTWLLAGVLVAAACVGGWRFYRWYTKEPAAKLPEVSKKARVSKEEKQEAQELLQKARGMESEWEGHGFQTAGGARGKIETLKEALEKDPTNTEARLELVRVVRKNASNWEQISETEAIEVLKEGLKYDLPKEDRIKLIKEVSKHGWSKEVFGSNEDVLWLAVKLDPYTDWAVKRRLIYAKYQAKEGAEDTLQFLDKAREVVKKHAKMKGTDPKKKLLYLDYLEGIYWKKKERYEKAADIFARLYDRGGVWKVNRSDLKKTVLPVLEKAKMWKDIKRIIENFGARKSVFDFDNLKSDSWSSYRKKVFLKTSDGQLWKKAKEKLGEEIPWEEVQ